MTQRTKYVTMEAVEEELSDLLDLDDGQSIRHITSHRRKNGVEFVIDDA